MPVHIEEMSSEVTVVEGELPMTMMQIDKLAKVVMGRIAAFNKAAESNRDATQLKRQSSAPFEIA
jgi:hypothetical protein